MTHYIEVVAAARETVAKMLTQRTGYNGFRAIVTTNGGRTAAVARNGDFVTLDLPSLAPDTVLTRAEADRMVAYLVHEVCHCLHTDFTVWQQAVAEGHRVKHWTNALEDVRIEAHEMRIGPYKAMKSLLSGLVTHLYAEAHTTLEQQGRTLGEGMLNAPYILTVLGRAANGYDVPITRPLKDSLAPNVRKVLDVALANVKQCRSTGDCLTVARQLVALERALKAEQQEQQQPQPPKPQQQPQQPQQGDQGDEEESDQGDDMRPGSDPSDDQGDDQGDSDQGDSDDQGEAEEEGGKGGACGEDEADQGPADDADDDQGGHGEGEKGDDQGEKDDQGDKGNAQQGDGSGGNYDPDEDEDQGAIEPDLSLGKTAEKISERTGDKADKHNSAHRLNSMACTRKRARNMHSRDMKGAADHLNSMSPQNGVLHGQISRLLVSEARTTQTHHETSGRLDRRALIRMRTGAPDVFTRRDFAPGVDTAVLVLIDLSGSMAGTIDLARVTAWAMAQAAESAGGKLAVAGFKGNSALVELQYVKDWTETAAQAAGALVSVVPNSATPLAAAIVGGAQDLVEQPATRRILIVLTDGQCDLGASAVHSACALAAAMGVEAVGIGMACEVVIRAFPKRYSVNVQDLNQLATTGLGTLTRMLEETGAR